MDEFLNRITAQRKVISIVNKYGNYSFDLVGLSRKSLERWKNENSIPKESELLKMLYLLADELFFLANKSQEQITKEYQSINASVNNLIHQLQNNIRNWL